MLERRPNLTAPVRRASLMTVMDSRSVAHLLPLSPKGSWRELRDRCVNQRRHVAYRLAMQVRLPILVPLLS